MDLSVDDLMQLIHSDDEPAPKAKAKATAKPADNSGDDSDVVEIHSDDDSYVCPHCSCVGNGCEYCLALLDAKTKAKPADDDDDRDDEPAPKPADDDDDRDDEPAQKPADDDDDRDDEPAQKPADDDDDRDDLGGWPHGADLTWTNKNSWETSPALTAAYNKPMSRNGGQTRWSKYADYDDYYKDEGMGKGKSKDIDYDDYMELKGLVKDLMTTVSYLEKEMGIMDKRTMKLRAKFIEQEERLAEARTELQWWHRHGVWQ
jgi:hypothetical protein